MQRTIQTPHDVVQLLIDIIALNENKFAIYTQYFKLTKTVKVSIVTRKHLYVCFYDLHGKSAEITRSKNHFRVNIKVLKACTFKVYDELTDFVSIETPEVKRRIIFI